MFALAFGELTAPYIRHYFLPRRLTFVRDVVFPMSPVYIHTVLFLPYRSFLCLERPV